MPAAQRAVLFVPAVAAGVLVCLSALLVRVHGFTPLATFVEGVEGVSPACVNGSRVINTRETSCIACQEVFARWLFINAPCMFRDGGSLDCSDFVTGSGEYRDVCEGIGGYAACMTLDAFKGNQHIERTNFQCFSEACSSADVLLIESKRLKEEEDVGGIQLRADDCFNGALSKHAVSHAVWAAAIGAAAWMLRA